MLSSQLKKKTFLPSLIFGTIYLGFSFGYKMFLQGTCGLKRIVTDSEVYFKETLWFLLWAAAESGQSVATENSIRKHIFLSSTLGSYVRYVKEWVLALLCVPSDGVCVGDAFAVVLEQFVKMLS